MPVDTTPASYEPAADYRIDLARVVKFDGLLLRGEITLTGSGKDLIHNEQVRAAYLGM